VKLIRSMTESKTVRGLAILDNKLHVGYQDTATIPIFSTDAYSCEHSVQLPVKPAHIRRRALVEFPQNSAMNSIASGVQDMASSRKDHCIYVACFDSSAIHKIIIDGKQQM